MKNYLPDEIIKKLNDIPDDTPEKIEEFKKIYGLNPKHIGLRHRGYFIISERTSNNDFDIYPPGTLCIKARDGGYNDVDFNASKHSNFIGSELDDFDSTYRYYHYKPLKNNDAKP